MGQKVNPNGLRVGINKEWEAQWYAGKRDFAKYLLEDNQIRHFIKDVYKPELKSTSEEPAVQQEGGEKFIKKLDDRPRISRVDIERCDKYLKVKVHTARPGLLIGQKGAGTEKIRAEIVKIAKKNGNNYPTVIIEFIPVKVADANAQLVAEDIANQLEKRTSFRRAMKMAMTRATKAGAKGIKTMVAGRLDGAEIARTEQYHEGSIPLQTLRADIDYGFAEAHTTYGRIGVKVWIYKGEVLVKKAQPRNEGGEA